MDVNNAARDSIDGVLGDDFAKGGEDAKIWLILLNNRKKVATFLDIMYWDIVFSGERVDGKWLANVGSREDESADFVLSAEERVKNRCLSFNALSELFVAKIDDFTHVSPPARGLCCL